MSIGKVKKLFLTKVEAVGYIYHVVNMVRVVSFSSDKFDKLLVNGHMDTCLMDQCVYYLFGGNERKSSLI